MIYYFAPILIGLLFSFYEVKWYESTVKNNSTRSLFVLFAAIIFCGGYMTGSDWVHYELMFNDATFSGADYYKEERGFYYYMLIFKELGFGFFPFLIVNKLFVFYIIVNFIKFFFRSFYLPFTIFLLTSALFLFVDNPLRFMIAVGIVIISYKYLINKKLIPFTILIIIASAFHVSSLFMFLIYFIPNINMSKKVLLIVYFFMSLILTPNFFIYLIGNFFPIIEIFLGNYYIMMFENGFIFFTIGRIVYTIFFILIVFNRDKIIAQSKYGNKIYTFTIIYFFVDLVGYAIPTFFRFKLFLILFFCLSMSTLILSVIKMRFFLRFFFISYLISSTIQSIYSTHVFTPYSSYFVSVFQKDLPYSYRVRYNKQKYFERNGVWPETSWDKFKNDRN